MKKKYQNLFIEENYLESQKTYATALKGANACVWDYVAITASSEGQAERYREQIDYRLRYGMIPRKTEYIVVPDPDGKRVGSGGACLNVLREIAIREERKNSEGKPLFSGLRILCIHSGGDSKRVPQYSVCGKLFAPMPRRMVNGLASTLFDEIMLTVSAFPSQMTEGMLTCSGDVLLLFDPQRMEYFSGGAAAVSIKTEAEVGCAHGVYLSDGAGRVRRFLHKQPINTLAACGAVDADGKVDIDTGAVLFDSEILRRLYSLADTEEKFRAVVNDRVRLSFYADFSYPMSVEATLGDYLCEKPEGAFTPELTKYRGELWRLLSDINMRLTVFSPARFLHFGTTVELRTLMTEELPSYWERSSWDRFINTDTFFRDRAEENVSVNGGVIADDAVIRRGSYIEDSYIKGGATVGEGCVISCSVIPEGAVIPRDTAVSTVKTSEGYVARVYGVYDDPKECVHFGKPISEPLWSARLFPVCATPDGAVSASLVLYCKGEDVTYSGSLESLEGSFAKACGSLSEYRERLFLDNMKNSFLSLADKKGDLYYFENVYRELEERLKAKLLDELKALTALSEIDKKWQSARMNAYLYALTSNGEYPDIAFRRFAQVILNGDTKPLCGARPVLCEKSVSLPLRVNFAGGWTDTPPYCIENGGAVLNAAVVFGDELPVTATVRCLPERKLVFIDGDSGERMEVCADTDSQLIEKCQPTEPFAIHKAALITCGLLCGGDNVSLFDVLDGGLELSTAVRGIPKGSGLGTSSILSGALISALYGLFGVDAESEEIWRKVFMAEQYIGVGGGWQDQVGGMTSGIKLISSEAGIDQRLCVTPVTVPTEAMDELEERFALIYTGQRREAKKILRGLMWEYVTGMGNTSAILSSLKVLAADMRDCLEKGDVDGFAELLTESCRRTERLCFSCSNLCIEEIFRAVSDLICGRMICGAGGGGYLQVILKKNVSYERLCERLYEVFGECDIKAQKCRFV